MKKTRLIGRFEKVDFPDLGLLDIEAKVDTGAYSSALHCHDITKAVRKGKEVLTFKLLDPDHPNYEDKPLSIEEFKESTVKNSFGQREKRFKIKTRVRLGRKIYKTEFTLTNRKEMRFPVLLGRKVLKNRFLVDVSKINLLEKRSVT